MLPTNIILAINNYDSLNIYSSTEVEKCDWAPKFSA